jgi:hypothetical protein
MPNVHLADDTTFHKQGQATVDGGSGYRFIQTLRFHEQLLRGEVTTLLEQGFEYSAALVGHPQTLTSKVFAKAV